jgi:hypothetical protein
MPLHFLVQFPHKMWQIPFLFSFIDSEKHASWSMHTLEACMHACILPKLSQPPGPQNSQFTQADPAAPRGHPNSSTTTSAHTIGVRRSAGSAPPIVISGRIRAWGLYGTLSGERFSIDYTAVTTARKARPPSLRPWCKKVSVSWHCLSRHCWQDVSTCADRTFGPGFRLRFYHFLWGVLWFPAIIWLRNWPTPLFK